VIPPNGVVAPREGQERNQGVWKGRSLPVAIAIALPVPPCEPPCDHGRVGQVVPPWAGVVEDDPIRRGRSAGWSAAAHRRQQAGDAGRPSRPDARGCVRCMATSSPAPVKDSAGEIEDARGCSRSGRFCCSTYAHLPATALKAMVEQLQRSNRIDGLGSPTGRVHRQALRLGQASRISPACSFRPPPGAEHQAAFGLHHPALGPPQPRCRRQIPRDGAGETFVPLAFPSRAAMGCVLAPCGARRMEVGRQLPVRGPGSTRLHQQATPPPDPGPLPSPLGRHGQKRWAMGPLERSPQAPAHAARGNGRVSSLAASRTPHELGTWGDSHFQHSAAARLAAAVPPAPHRGVHAPPLAQGSRWSARADAKAEGIPARGMEQQPDGLAQTAREGAGVLAAGAAVANPKVAPRMSMPRWIENPA